MIDACVCTSKSLQLDWVLEESFPQMFCNAHSAESIIHLHQADFVHVRIPDLMYASSMQVSASCCLVLAVQAL